MRCDDKKNSWIVSPRQQAGFPSRLERGGKAGLSKHLLFIRGYDQKEINPESIGEPAT